MREADIQKQIFDYLVCSDFLVLRINSGRKGYIRFVFWQALGLDTLSEGVSDLLALSPQGRLYAIELKKPGGKATKDQSIFLLEAGRRGAIPVVATCLEDIQRLL